MSNSISPSSDIPQQQQSSSQMTTRDANGNVTSTASSYHQEMAYQGPVTITTQETTKHHATNSITGGQSQRYGVASNYSEVPVSQYTAGAGGHYASYQAGAQYQATGQYQASSQYQAGTSQYQGSGQVVSGAPFVTGQSSKTTTKSSSVGGFVNHVGGSSSLVVTSPETSRVIGHEYGQERVISVTQRVDETRAHIVNERTVEHEIKVPKKIIREDVIEKVIVIPETIRNEEYIEEIQKVREKIVEFARPIIIERIIETPEIEVVERTIEVPEKIFKEKIREVEKVVLQERINEVVKIIPTERVVEVPDIQYREVVHERVVHVDDWRDEIVVKEVPVPQYVDKPVAQYVNVEVPVDIERNLPVAVEANVVYEYRLPRIKPRYTKLTYPVYLPRFIEVPVAVELLNSGLVAQAESYLTQVGMLTKTAASLCEIENLATSIMKSDVQSQLSTVDLQGAIMKAWQTGALQVSNVGGTTTTTTTTANTTSLLVK